MPNSRLLAAFIAAFVALVLLPASASALKFASPPGSPIAGQGAASDIASGDFDNDGDADLVFATGTEPLGLNLQLSDGDGTFTTGTPLATGAPGYYSVYTGDFNGDGNMDVLALPYQSTTLKTFLGNGDGTFSFGADTPTFGGPGGRNAIAVGDLNEDGRDDIVIGSPFNTVSTGLGNGSGGFEMSSPAMEVSNFQSATIADFTGDGNLDAAVATQGAIYTFVGDGGGSLNLVSGSNTLAAPAGPIQSLASADFDGDGRADVAASSIHEAPNGNVQTFLGQVNGSLLTNPAATGIVSSGMNPADVVSGDFNNDGNADLAYLARETTCNCPEPLRGVSVVLGDGDGGFTEATGTPPSQSPYRGNASNAEVFGLTVGDMNDDGALDLAAGIFAGSNTGVILLNEPDVIFDPDSISFNERKVGTSTTVTRTLVNQGGPSVTVDVITLDGEDITPFVLSDSAADCFGVLAPDETCSFDITFTPTSTGLKYSQVKVEFAETETPLYLAMYGEAVTSAASVNPVSLDFEDLRINTTETRTVTVTSSGEAALEIDQLSLTGTDASRFSLSNDTCSNEAIAVDSTCTVSVTASPTAIGSLSASLQIPNDGAGVSNPSSVPITANAINPAISVSPTSAILPNAEIDGVGQVAQFEVTSEGTTPLVISGITDSGTNAADFSKAADQCSGSTLAVDDTCTFLAVFRPEEGPEGTRSANLTIDSNADDLVVPVSGIATRGNTVISPNPVTFGDVKTGQSVSRSVTLTAAGTADMYVQGLTLGGADAADFSIGADGCSDQQTPSGGSCDVELILAPGAIGAKTATLTVDTDTQIQVVDLSGTGINPGGSLTPASQDFGSVTIGETGAARNFQVASTGSTPLSVTSAAISGPGAGSFSLANATACNGSKEPGSNCELSVAFAPESGSAGNRSATLTVVTDAGSFTSSLTGTAVAVPVPPPVTTSATIRLKSAGKVKRGKKLTVTATVKNTGSSTIIGLSLKTSVPKKFAKVPKVVRIAALAPGASVKRTIKVMVKKSAKPGKKLKVTVTASAAGKTLARSNRVARVRK